jgi:hypothetical protein
METEHVTPAADVFKSAFIGREVEKGFFAGAVEQVSRGKGCLLLLSGEPGIGKSRLADELATHAAARGFVVAWGRCWEAGGAPAYWPIVQALRSCAGQFSRDAVEEAAGQRAAEIAQILPELREMLGELHEPPSLDPEAARFRLFDGTTLFLTRLSQAQPIFLVFDDVHVADTPSLLFLRFLADGIDSARVLILAAYRDPDPDRDKPLDPALLDLNRSSVTRPLKLGGLSRSDVSQFLEANAGQPAPEALATLLHEETEGNPLFLGEVVRLLASEGRITQSPTSGFRLTVPESVRVAISRRLARLSPETRELLGWAAVLGREFSLDVLELLVSRARAELLPLLDEATEFRLLAPSPESPGKLRFSHALIRDVLYDALQPSGRLKLHQKAGVALEQCYGANPEPHLAELAYHFVEAAAAGEAVRAVDYSRRAGERAAALLAHEEAARLYQLALSVLELTAATTEKERCDLLLALGEAQAKSGEYWAAKSTFGDAAEIARQAGTAEQLARAAVGYGGRWIWGRAAGDSRLISLLKDALDALGPVDSPLRALTLARLAGALRDFPEAGGADLAREAVAIARRLESKPTLALVLAGLGGGLWRADNIEERLEIAGELIEVAAQGGLKEQEFEGHGWRLFAALERADIETVRHEFAIKQRMYEEIRQPSYLWWLLQESACFSLSEGDLVRADELSRQGLDIGRRSQASDCETAYAVLHPEIRRQQDRAADTERLLVAAARDFTWYPMFRCLLARHCCETGRLAEARAIFEDLVTPETVKLPFDNEWLFGITTLGQVCFLLEDGVRASLLYEQLLPYADRVVVAPGEMVSGSASVSLGLLATCLRRWSDAERHFQRAIEVNAAMGFRLWQTQAQHDYAVMLLSRDESGDREKGARLTSEALRTAKELDLPALQRRVESLQSVLTPSASQHAAVQEADCTFRREGEYWSIGHRGRTMRLKDSKGLEYIARLLASPGQEIHVLDLLTGGSASAGSSARADLAEHGIGAAAGGGGDVLDSQARQAYRSRLEELREEIAEAEDWNDPERAAYAREEMDFIAGELSQSLGLGGRSRRETSEAERARQSVTKAIKQAVARIAKHDPELAESLGRSVQTGLFCRYEPALSSGLTWQT